MVSGATQNNAKKAAATRAYNASEPRPEPPPKSPDRPYNGGLGEAAKSAIGEKVMLSIVEIQAGDSLYRPSIEIRHGTMWGKDAHGKTMGPVPHLWLRGRCGKQTNFNNVYLNPKDNGFEIHTGGATKGFITLAEWQAFIDGVDVRVADICKNTIGPLTPELTKMAHDVIARRRKAPTDAEWAAELEVSRDKPSQKVQHAELALDTVVKMILNHVEGDTKNVDLVRIGAVAVEYFMASDQFAGDSPVGFADKCGMADKAAWTKAFLDTVADDYFSLEFIWWKGGRGELHSKRMPLSAFSARYVGYRIALELTFPAPAQPTPAVLPQQLQAAIDATGPTVIKRNGTVLINPRFIKQETLGGYALEYESNYGIEGGKTHKGQINWTYTQKFIRDGNLEISGDLSGLPDEVRELVIERSNAQPARSNEDAMADALASKYPVDPKKIDELVEALQYAVAHPGNPEAQELPDGFTLDKTENAWRLTHPALDRRIMVASMLNVATAKPGKDRTEMKYVAMRGEIRLMLLQLKEKNVIKRSTATGGIPTIGQVMSKMTPPVREQVSVPAVKQDVPAWNLVDVGGKLVQGL